MKLIILTDISTKNAASGEPDDTQSLIRLLLYSDQFDILGLIATYTKHLGRAEPAIIHYVLEAYGRVYDALARSGRPFMRPDALAATIRAGSDTLEGASSKGPSSVSEGARHIVQCVDESEEPVWIAIWGGVYDLAQAIFLARQEKDEHAFAAFLTKLRVYAISDQYDGWGPILREAFPSLFYIISRDVHRGMYRGGDVSYCTPEWIQEHFVRGPLGTLYPVYDGGDPYGKQLGRVKGLKDSDAPSFIGWIENGLSVPEHPEWGGWGGRFAPIAGTAHYTDARDHVGGNAGTWESVYRWRADIQRDMAARIALSCGERKTLQYPRPAYHGPLSLLPGSATTLRLSCDLPCTISWTYYPEAGSYQGTVLLSPDQESCGVFVPSTVQTGDLHIIAAATSPDGLTRYCRIILYVAHTA